MVTPLEIPDLEEVCPPLADARRRREELLEEGKKLRTVVDGAGVASNRTTFLNDPVSERRSNEVAAELDDLTREIHHLEREARSALKDQVKRDKGLRALVLATSRALAARVEPLRPFVSYALLIRAAGRHSIILPALPRGVQSEIDEALAWARSLRREGLLDLADVPPTLRELLGEDDHLPEPA